MNDFQLNDVVVRPRLNEILIDGRQEKLPAKFIDVLMALAERQGELCGKSELLKRVWNDPAIGEDSLANAVWMLRKTLGDDAKRPIYIETVPRRGYRLLAVVSPVPVSPGPPVIAAGPCPARESIANDSSVADSTPALPTLLPAAPIEAATPIATTRRTRFALLLALVLIAVAALASWLSLQPVASSAIPAVPFAFRTGGEVASVTVPESGTALVADKAGTLYSIDTRHGTERWRFTAAARLMVPASVSGERLFLGGDDAYVYALDYRSGREVWRFAASHAVHSVPLLHNDQLVFGDIQGGVQAVRSADAKPLWQVKFDSRVVGNILGPLDLAVVRLLDGTVAGLDRADGAIRWQRHFAGPLSDLVIASDSQLILASDAGYLIALDGRDGATLWQSELPAAEVRPLVIGDVVYGLGRYGDLVAVRRTSGDALWHSHLPMGDVHELVWWHDRIVVVMDGGVLGLVDPADGRVERRLRLPEIPDGMAVDGQRLIVTAQSGRVVAIDRGMLGGLDGNELTLGTDALLRASAPQDSSGPAFALERLQDGASLPSLKWRVPVVGHVQSVATGTNGTVYFGDERSAVAMTDDGKLQWRESLGPASSTLFSVTDARVYFGRRDRYVYALDRDSGTIQWRFASGAQIISPPTVVGDRVYVGSDDRHLYALSADSGTVLWSFETQRPVRGGVVSGSGRVVFGSADHHVYAVDASDGALLWKFRADDWVVADPVLVGNRVFVGAGNGDFHALDLLSGKPLWRFRSGEKIWCRPAVDEENVYFGSGDGHIYALDQASGVERWRYRTGAAAEGTVVLANGVLYAGSHDFHLYALDSRTGKPHWRLRTGGSVFNPDVGNGMLYVASADQHLYALKL